MNLAEYSLLAVGSLSVIMEWLGLPTPGRPKVILTHGEARGRESLAALLHQRHRIKDALLVQDKTPEP